METIHGTLGGHRSISTLVYGGKVIQHRLTSTGTSLTVSMRP